MNSPTIIIGVVVALFGCSTIVLRHTHTQWFKKLGPMKEKFGQTGGYIIHFIGYSLVPIVLGGAMIYSGMQGVSFF
jgi:hypothetical protein